MNEEVSRTWHKMTTLSESSKGSLGGKPTRRSISPDTASKSNIIYRLTYGLRSSNEIVTNFSNSSLQL